MVNKILIGLILFLVPVAQVSAEEVCSNRVNTSGWSERQIESVPSLAYHLAFTIGGQDIKPNRERWEREKKVCFNDPSFDVNFMISRRTLENEWSIQKELQKQEREEEISRINSDRSILLGIGLSEETVNKVLR